MDFLLLLPSNFSWTFNLHQHSDQMDVLLHRWQSLSPWIQHTALVTIKFQLSLLLPTLMRLIHHYYMKEPYHTSILSGYAWLQELLQGYYEHIHTELGVHKDVFYALVRELQSMGHHDTRYVTLEEQVAIFLYTSVTLVCTSCWRAISACKWDNFQVSIAIIDDNPYANQITDILKKWLSSSHLNLFMANMFKVQLPMILSLPGFIVTANYGLPSKDALEPLMVAICPSLHLLPFKVSIGIKKAFFHRTVFYM